MLEPAPYSFFGIVSFVEGGLFWPVGMSKLRIKKSLRKVTAALEAFVAAIEMDEDQKTVRAYGEQHILNFHNRCQPEGPCVLQFGPTKSLALFYLVDHSTQSKPCQYLLD